MQQPIKTHLATESNMTKADGHLVNDVLDLVDIDGVWYGCALHIRKLEPRRVYTWIECEDEPDVDEFRR